MAALKFLKGLRASMPATITEGNVYICSDERSMYIDVASDKRIRIGDFQEFETLAALQANVNPSTTALYYIKSDNILAKWDGTQYVKINIDTGATSFEVTGDGNVITAVSYDATTRKLTLTKGMTAATPADIDTKISAATGDLTYNETTYGTVKEYVDAKTSGIATDAALGDLQARVTATEGEIDTLQGQVGVGTVASQIDTKIEALKLGETYEPIGTGATEAGKVQTALDEYKESNDEAVAKVVEDLGKEVARAEAAEGVNAAAAKAADDKAVAAQGEIDALEQLVGTPDEGKTVVQMIKDIPAYDDTKVKEDIAANAADIAEVQGEVDVLNGNAETEGSVDYKIAQAVAAIMENPDETMNSINELVTWVNGHAEDALQLSNQVETNKTDISNLKAQVGTGTVQEQIAAAIEASLKTEGADKYALAADLTAALERIVVLEAAKHTHANATVLEGITAEKVAAWDATEGNAKGYADGLNTAMDARMQVVESKAHEHSNKTELDLIQSGDVAKWNAAEQNAKDYADGLADNYDVAGAAATAKTEAVAEANAHSDAIKTELSGAISDGDSATLTSAKSYAESLLVWGEF